MDTYVTKRDGTREVFGSMITEELDDVGYEADAELVYFDAREFNDEATAERSAEATPEFIEAQEGDGSELKLDGEINSVLQGVVEKFGGDPSDWHCTYAESSDQFFDGETLIDQKGASIEGLIPEDRLAQYQELIETWKDNSHEVQHLEWWEKTDEGEILHVTALSLGENGEVVSETWSHDIEGIVAAPDDDLEFAMEILPDDTPEGPIFLRAENLDPDPRILDLTAYLEASPPTQEILDEDARIVELPRVLAAHTAPRPEGGLVSSELVALTAPLDGQRGSVTKERPTEVITPAADTIEPHEEILEFKIRVPETAEPIQAPEAAMPTLPPAARVNIPDVLVFDKGSESHSGDSSEGVAILDVSLGISTKERERPEQAPLEVVPPKTPEQSIADEHIFTAPETTDAKTDAKDGAREIAPQVDRAEPEEISSPREIVSADELARKVKPYQESETVRPRSENVAIPDASLGVSIKEREEPDAVTNSKPESIWVPLEVVPLKVTEQSIVDEHIFVKPEFIRTSLEVSPPEAVEKNTANNPISTAPKLAEVKDGVREIVLHEDQVAPEKIALPRESVSQPAAPELSLRGIDSAPRAQKLDSEIQVKKTEAQKEEPGKDAVEISPQLVDKARETKLQDPEIADTDLIDTAHDTREEDPASAPPAVLGRREILLRSFGLTSEQIRRYQGERQDGLHLARVRGANNAPVKASGITRAHGRRNGISLLRSAA